jgi:Homeodomain-like domain
MRPSSVYAKRSCPAGNHCDVLALLHGPHRVARRLVMVLLSQQRLDPTTIAELLGCDARTVRRWVHRYNHQGTAESAVAAGWPVGVAAGRPATGRSPGPTRQGQRGPARGARWPRQVAARPGAAGRGASQARPALARVRQRPIRQSRSGIWHRPPPRRPPRPAPCRVRAVGHGGSVGR